jgi:hypothetical protein
MSYDLLIQPKESGAAIGREEAESFIASMVGVRAESAGVFAFQRQGLFIHIYTGESARIDSIEVSVPAAFSGANGKQALPQCFEIAQHLGWLVFDPQVGDYLNNESRADLHDDDEVRTSGSASFGERFWTQLQNHDAVPTVVVLILAAASCRVLCD